MWLLRKSIRTNLGLVSEHLSLDERVIQLSVSITHFFTTDKHFKTFSQSRFGSMPDKVQMKINNQDCKKNKMISYEKSRHDLIIILVLLFSYDFKHFTPCSQCFKKKLAHQKNKLLKYTNIQHIVRSLWWLHKDKTKIWKNSRKYEVTATIKKILFCVRKIIFF